jgi:hypothetical protein
MTNAAGSSFRNGRAIVHDGRDSYIGNVEVAGRTVALRGHVRKAAAVVNGVVPEWELGQPVDRTWINRALSIDWLADEAKAS